MSVQIIDPTLVTTTSTHQLHTIGWVTSRAYRYVQANGAIGVGKAAFVNQAGQATPVTATVTTHSGLPIGIAQTAIANDSYGWLQVFGPCTSIDTAGTVSNGEELFAAAWGRVGCYGSDERQCVRSLCDCAHERRYH